jgi:hypothetical protein
VPDFGPQRQVTRWHRVSRTMVSPAAMPRLQQEHPAWHRGDRPMSQQFVPVDSIYERVRFVDGPEGSQSSQHGYSHLPVFHWILRTRSSLCRRSRSRSVSWSCRLILKRATLSQCLAPKAGPACSVRGVTSRLVSAAEQTRLGGPGRS